MPISMLQKSRYAPTLVINITTYLYTQSITSSCSGFELFAGCLQWCRPIAAALLIQASPKRFPAGQQHTTQRLLFLLTTSVNWFSACSTKGHPPPCVSDKQKSMQGQAMHCSLSPTGSGSMFRVAQQRASTAEAFRIQPHSTCPCYVLPA